MKWSLSNCLMRSRKPVIIDRRLRDHLARFRLNLESLEDRLAPANIIWADVGTDWTVGTNWQGNTPPGAGDIAVFPNAASIFNQPNIPVGGATVGGIQIDNTGADYAITGVSNLLTIGAGGITLTSGATSIAPDIALGVDQTWDTASGSTLTANGIITGAGISKDGAGTMELFGINTYVGATNVNAGTLTLGGNDVLPDTTSLTVSGGGVVNISTHSDTVNSVQLVNGSINGSGGVLTSASDFDVRSGAISAILDGSVGLVKTTVGTVSLSGINQYSGVTTVLEGTLQLNGDAPDGLGGSLGNASSAVLVGDIGGSNSATLAIGAGFSVDRDIDIRTGSSGVKVLNGIGGAAINGSVTLFDPVQTLGDLEIDGVISGSSGIVAAGTLLVLSGASSYTGSTDVNAGTLLVNGSIASSTTVNVQAAATVGGDGAVPQIVSTGGIVSPGDAPGGISLPGSLDSDILTLDAASTFAADLDAPASFDQLFVINGAVNLNGAALSLTLNFTPAAGNTFTIIDNDTSTDPVSGTFGGLPQGAIFIDGSEGFQISYVGGDGNDVVLTAIGPTSIWDGDIDNLWSNRFNWVGDALPALGDNLVFPAGASNPINANDLPAGLDTFNSIIFEAGGYTISGNDVVLDDGVTSTGSNLFGPNIALGNDQTFRSSSGTLTVGGAVDATGFKLTVDGDTTFSGDISGINGALIINRGSVALLGNDSYDDGTTLNSGATLRLGTDTALGTNSITNILTINGGTIEALGGARTVDNDLAINGGFLGFTGANALTFTGTTTLALTTITRVPAGLTVTFAGDIQAIGPGVTLVGGGTLVLDSVANTYSGQTTVGAGSTLLVNGAIASSSGVIIPRQIVTAAVNAAGSGYTIGDILTIQGGSFIVPGQLVVTSVGGVGEVTGVALKQPGAYSVLPGSPASVTGGSGTGADFNLTGAGGGTLGGTGIVPDVTSFGGTVSPGAPPSGPAILTSENLSLDATSTFTVQLNGTVAGAGGHDQLVVAGLVGSVGLNGASLNATVGFASNAGDTFTIIDNDGTTDAVTGTFNGLAQGATFTSGGLSFQINYAGGDGNDVVLTNVTPGLVVTNTNDSGPGSLRQAIVTANTQPGTDTITFNIFGTGPHTIQPLSALPVISETVTIDACTQPGASVNTATGTINAVLQIELDGSLAGAPGVNGLTIAAPAAGSTIKGLVINRFSGHGIVLNSTGNFVVGNFIGTDVGGTLDRGNTGSGVYIVSANNTIGGIANADWNIISGNNQHGVYIFGGSATANLVESNFIGMDKTGIVDLGNTLNGVTIDSASGNIIGAAGARNSIKFNDNAGVLITGVTSTGNTVQGNYIGSNSAAGVVVDAARNNFIGMPAAGLDNAIGANGSAGIVITGVGASGNLVRNNSIGTDSSGTLNLPNTGFGIAVTAGATGNTIGGSAPGASNLIKFNAGGGILIDGGGVTNNSTGFNGNLQTTVVNSGTLTLVDAGAIPVTSAVTVAGGGTLDLNNLDDLIGSLAGGGTVLLGTALLTTGGDNTSTTFSGTISGSGGLIKTGTGIFTLAGTAANTYAGDTVVNGGVLELGKSAGVDAFAGDLYVGDNDGTASNDVVRWLADDQIRDTVTVVVSSSGLLDLNGRTDTFNNLTVASGFTSGARVQTGTGTLRLGGTLRLVVVGLPAVGAGSVGASINGNLDFLTGPHTIDVPDGAAAQDLAILAAISGTANLDKIGAGTLQFGGLTANTFFGTTFVREGTLELAKAAGADAIPGALVVGDTVIGGAAADVVRLIGNDQIKDAATVTVGESGVLDLNGQSDAFSTLIVTSGSGTGASVSSGAGTLGLINDLRLVVSNGGNAGATISGNLRLLVGPHSIDVANGATLQDLTISAAISGTGSLVKDNLGTLRLSGTTANTYGGVLFGTVVSAGTLELAKGPGIIAVPGDLLIGDNDGTPNNDVVRLFAANQIADLAKVSITNSGLLDLNGFADAIGSLGLVSGISSASNVTTGNGILTLGGNVDLTSLPNSGVAAVINGNLDLAAGNHIFNVANGAVAIDLDLSATISGSGGIIKDGPGTIAFRGASANTYTGLTTVNDGTLLLNKPAGVTALAANLVVGDGSGTPGSAAVRLLSNDQVVDTADIFVKADGDFSYGLFTDTVNLLDMTVGNTADAGPGSLRQALINANINPRPDMIRFLSGSGAVTIQPLSPLPVITDPLTIDGTTQPGFAGTPLVQLVSNNAAGTGDGLVISGGSSIIRGLAIMGFPGSGIRLLNGGGNIVDASFIGNDGGSAPGNGNFGIAVVDSPNNLIQGNVISGNALGGISISGAAATGNAIAQNVIGTDRSGGTALGNGPLGDGVALTGVSGNVVSSNIIAGNGGAGLSIKGGGGNAVVGNLIGTNAAGAALGNSLDGVDIVDSPANNIGGPLAADGNVISFNGRKGLVVTGNLSVGNNILSNTFSGNKGLAIDLGDDGVTLQSNPLPGPNNWQATPVLLGARIGSISLRGTVTGPPSTNLLLQFFSNAPGGSAQGQVLLGSASVTTNTAGLGAFQTVFNQTVSPGSLITSTVTGPFGTSEFSAALAAQLPVITPPDSTTTTTTTAAAATTAAEAASSLLVQLVIEAAQKTQSSEAAVRTFLNEVVIVIPLDDNDIQLKVVIEQKSLAPIDDNQIQRDLPLVGSETSTERGALTGSVFIDTQGSGERQADKQGLGGMLVFIDANHNGLYDEGESVAVTDRNGDFTFRQMPYGEYTVVLAKLPRNLRQSFPKRGGHKVLVSPEQKVVDKINFGCAPQKRTPSLGPVGNLDDQGPKEDGAFGWLANQAFLRYAALPHALDAEHAEAVTGLPWSMAPEIKRQRWPQVSVREPASWGILDSALLTALLPLAAGSVCWALDGERPRQTNVLNDSGGDDPED